MEKTIDSTFTDNTGNYTLNVDASKAVKIRAKARTFNNVGATWDFEVRDNTNSNGLYVLDGSSVSSGTANSVRNLTATSGWGVTSYISTRAAAPFAILDSVYAALQKVVAADATVVMDDADIFWSINNSTASGSIANGEIGTSYYLNDQMYILGTVNSDTDEYDDHIIIHEWAHYFEDNLSRSDSIGGAHTTGDKLDMSVALGEGFGNAFSGMVTDDPAYRDSFGNLQGSDFEINVETNASLNPGWFSEFSVQTILYDIYDSTADANDSVSLGFTPIYNAMTSTAYRTQPTLTSIFSLVDKIQDDNPGSLAAINTLTTSQSITAIADEYGTGETNNGGNVVNLPVYKIITDNGVPVQVCNHKDNGETNKLGVSQFLRLNVTAPAGSRTIVATRASGTITSSDPDITVLLNGSVMFTGFSEITNTETVTQNFTVDEYILEIVEFSNIDGSSSSGGDVCFNVTVS